MSQHGKAAHDLLGGERSLQKRGRDDDCEQGDEGAAKRAKAPVETCAVKGESSEVRTTIPGGDPNVSGELTIAEIIAEKQLEIDVAEQRSLRRTELEQHNSEISRLREREQKARGELTSTLERNITAATSFLEQAAKDGFCDSKYHVFTQEVFKSKDWKDIVGRLIAESVSCLGCSMEPTSQESHSQAVQGPVRLSDIPRTNTSVIAGLASSSGPIPHPPFVETPSGSREGDIMEDAFPDWINRHQITADRFGVFHLLYGNSRFCQCEECYQSDHEEDELREDNEFA
ncbi:uncharacterized protein EI97DRAFT_459158 [Westerdykella ornata]|uniref:Uncharacterized protein n=1 Tax=Westerdykella ornata TaxID=318751 RepID=A0A6A6JJ57_WESOR|nr:uncharacterized protein EI97DRAFT_459158 [Westerdykella ornata]KAF2275696.1 hypothetical protein EI97DRAFT_459158 [Westerdykella ornata]